MSDIPKHKFKCYLCEEICNKKDKGGVIGSGKLVNEICTKCIHKNYCWATDKDLSTHNFTELETRRQELLHRDIV